MFLNGCAVGFVNTLSIRAPDRKEILLYLTETFPLQKRRRQME